jgi:hypothetical protein
VDSNFAQQFLLEPRALDLWSIALTTQPRTPRLWAEYGLDIPIRGHVYYETNQPPGAGGFPRGWTHSLMLAEQGCGKINAIWCP